jgi:hypothetical protein
MVILLICASWVASTTGVNHLSLAHLRLMNSKFFEGKVMISSQFLISSIVFGTYNLLKQTELKFVINLKKQFKLFSENM